MAKADTELLQKILEELKKIRELMENNAEDEDIDNGDEIEDEPDEDEEKDQGETDKE